MRRWYTLLLAGLCLCVWRLPAQDPSFSQFYAHRNYLNPALTGLDPGLSLTAISRLQWLRADRGFRTYGAAAEIREPFIRSGLGLDLLHNTEGVGNLATTSIGFSYAYTIPGDKNNFHLGIRTAYVQKTLDWSKFIFSDQLDPVLGPVYGTAAQPGLERVSLFDIDFGAVWRFDSGLSLGRGTIRQSRSMIGFSVHHLPGVFGSPQLRESFQDLETIVPPRFTLHMGTIIPTTILKGAGREIAFSPNFKFDMQGVNLLNFSQNLKVFTLGTYVLYEGLYLGAFYQDMLPLPTGLGNTNAVILSIGGYLGGHQQQGGRDQQRLFIGLSVDVNTTGLGVSGGNTYELALRYNLADAPSLFGRRGSRQRAAERLMDCKDFF
jgi:type IX secretion system PorP/SprF family membrane protein